LRVRAGLTQEGLAEAATLSSRSVSDLERGINLTARKETARLLADALGLAGPDRAAFEAAARGRAVAGPLAGDGAAGGGAAGGGAVGGGAAVATRTLPRDVASFTGRDGELGELLGAAAGTLVGIHAIGGMAGVGKTAFAVHAAHRLAPRFPDGQVFLPLHGHTPGQRPVDPDGAPPCWRAWPRGRARLTRWPGWPAARWPLAVPPACRPACGRHGRSSSGSAPPRPPTCPPNSTPSPRPVPLPTGHEPPQLSRGGGSLWHGDG
jgi:DNA-binding XRE family transcriptional regulator